MELFRGRFFKVFGLYLFFNSFILMTCGDIFRVIIAFFIPPLGVFTQVGFTQPFWINLVIYLFAVGGLGFPVLFGMWPAAVIHALFVILTRK